jgi:hypothetical protein
MKSSSKPDIGPAIFRVRPEIRQVESGIRPDTCYKKKAGLLGRISGAFLVKYDNFLKYL